MNKLKLLSALLSLGVTFAWTAVASAVSSRPETWFHLIGGNVSKAGITADLEAIKAAGIGGVHLFHGQMGKNVVWPGVTEPIPCLSERWEDMIVHTANECERLGLMFRMQNCPGWSMSGGPWITSENAMRILCYARADVVVGAQVKIDVPRLATDKPERDYHDLFVVAFPTPVGDDGKWLKPSRIENKGNDVRYFDFVTPVTIRTLELPSTSALDHNRTYDPEMIATLSAIHEDGREEMVVKEVLPPGNWQDNRYDGMRLSLACDETSAKRWKLEIKHKDPIRLGNVNLGSSARMDNWEGLAGWTIRGLVDRGIPRQDPRSWIGENDILDITGKMKVDGVLDWNPPDARKWTVLRIGHVNSLCKNGPAPAEATGWECSKLSRKGVEANYVAYIGNLAKGKLKGKIKGMVVDSWECYRQNWTDGLDVSFRERCGYDLVRKLPAVFGWVIGSPESTWKFLLDWRGFIGKLVEENYYARMAELAHEDGLEVQYETAFGDALAGDILEFWKYADTPMCEFWRPSLPTGVGSHDFKPVKPCVSAAHIYGFKRVAAEALTNCALTWDEALRDFKPVLDRHFARGVTHPVFHTYTHNPQVGFKKPGTSFGYFIGTPFLRGQSWWPYMSQFTDYCARCTEFLEAGLPVVDILRVLGDGLGHKPSEKNECFGNRFKDDYVNYDGLMNRIAVKDGRVILPDGMSYTILWIPEGTYLNEKSMMRIRELEKAGANVVRGDDPTSGLVPDVETPDGRLLWYHRNVNGEDRYFIAAVDAPMKGTVSFRGRKITLDLEQGESRFIYFAENGKVTQIDPVTGKEPVPFPTAQAVGDFKPGDESVRIVFGATECGQQTIVDLGRIEQCAEVFVNGHSAAKLWCAPYRADISHLVRKGENVLEVKSTATWYNRLVKDAALPESERSTWTLYGPKADAELKPAGIYGPIRVWQSNPRD